MALTFRSVTRKILAGKETGKLKTYAMVKNKGQMPLSEVCELVSSRSSFSASDVRGILEGLAWSVGFLLRTGHSVQLGDLGCFRVSVSSYGTEVADDLTATAIRKARVLFTPGAMLRDTLAKLEFVPVNPVVVEVEKECNKPHM